MFCPATRWSGAAIPASQSRHPEINDWARPLIPICDEGFQSSLAVATLPRLGLVNATDLDGGFAAWGCGQLAAGGADQGTQVPLGHHVGRMAERW
ncbi:MAG TPA: rhodanese-like domain-containing protein [Streptosporangiaceae bacterium]|nr:rhodanese-like domain-containing protein [Streptosporangiaceae bacterium]